MMVINDLNGLRNSHCFIILASLMCAVLFNPLSARGSYDEIGVVCSQKERLAVVYSGELPQPQPDAKIYAIERISQYTQKKKPTVICSFPEGYVSVTGGMSPISGRRNNVTIYINGVSTYDRLWLYRQGKESVQFLDGTKVHVQNCDSDEMTNVFQCGSARTYTTLFTGTTAAHPSFNCDDSRTVVERLVCDDVKLAAADNEMSKIYRAIRKTTSEGDGVVRNHKLWIEVRGIGCGLLDHGLYPDDITQAKRCLLETYQEEILKLRAAAGEFGH